jgi:hypothetical protein
MVVRVDLDTERVGGSFLLPCPVSTSVSEDKPLSFGEGNVLSVP